MSTMQRLVDSFLANLSAERGLSVNTLTAYGQDLTQFLGYLRDRQVTDVTAIGPDHVEGFLAQGRQAGLRGTSLARKATSVKMWMQYLCRDRHRADDPTEAAEGGKMPPLRLPQTLSLPEIERLLTVPALDTPEGLRDRAMLEITYGCGLRVSELVALKSDDVDVRAGLIRPFGKGRKERQVPLGDGVRESLAAYLSSARSALLQDKPPTPFLFVTRQGRPDDPPALPGAGEGLRAGSPHFEDDLAPHSTPFIRNPPALRRGGPAGHSRNARPRQRSDHPALHPGRRRPSAGSLRQDSPEGLS